jgi:microcystin degradation protein MlrC
MRIFFAGVMHEASSVSPIPTTPASFDWQLWRPRLAPEPPPHVDLCGMGPGIAEARRRGHDAVAGYFGMAQPSAPMQAAGWAEVRDEILADLDAAMPVDAVFLMLHGAQTSVGEDDCEGDLIARVRARVGTAVPIGVELALHTNLSGRMVQEATAIIACKQYPHIDYPERAIELLDILEGAHTGRIAPVMAAARVPILGLFPTTAEPVAGFVTRLSAAEVAPILSVSALHGFSLADHPDVGASVLAVADGNLEAARDTASRLAEDFLQTLVARGDIAVDTRTALDLAQAANGLTVIADSCDNPGGGAPGDDTTLLANVLDRGLDRVALGVFWDPVVVDFAHSVGVGGRLKVRLGGKCGPQSGSPVDLDVEVMAVRTDACQAAFGKGPPVQPLGRSAWLRSAGVDIVVNDVRQQVFSPHCFTAHGIEIRNCNLIVVKSSQHFYTGFRPLADAIIYCDTGAGQLPDRGGPAYHRLHRPIYPLDPAGSVTISEL